VRWNELKRSYADRIEAMAKLAPHELLGVDPGTPKEQIRAAYLQLVKAYHPDGSDPFMAKHNQEVTKLLNSAYQKLRDVT
jgi:DnaJ-class molecular chaperone